MKYVVVLPTRPPGGVEVAARAMAEAFGISQPKAAGLLRRAPGPLTKGIDEREAVRVAYRLRKLGLAVEVRPVDAEPTAAATGRAHRAMGSGAARRREASAPAEPATTSSAVRSPFLSQVDEAPSPIPGLDDVPPRAPRAPDDRRHRDRRRGRASDETARPRTPLPPSEAPRAEEIRADAPRAEGIRADAPPAAPDRAEPQPQPDPVRSTIPDSAPTPAAEQVAHDATPTGGSDGGGAPPSPGSDSTRRAGPYRTGERSGVRPAPATDEPRGGRSPFGRYLRMAAVLPGVLAFTALAVAWFAMPEPSVLVALAVGAAVLAVAAVWVSLAGRPLLREHDRVLAETVRISRGDLARPVQASDRYPEAVQALERIRVSLQEGLDRLRRRRPVG